MDQTQLMKNSSHLNYSLHTHTSMIFPFLPISSHLTSFSPPNFLPQTLVMFDPRKRPPNSHNHILDPVTTLTDSYDSWETLNFDFQVSQKLGNQFRVQKMEDHEDNGAESGASSPSLWQNSPRRSPVHPINYRSLSPSSRAQAIARGQWELMEMVKNMPESCFELSLKDLVEQPKSFEPQQECLINNSEKNKVVHNRVNIKKNDQIRKAKMMRSKSIEHGGLFIKMVSPVSLRSKKKKKKNSSANTTRVSPKPEEFENSSKSLEKEWWKKRFSGSSSGCSSNSGSTDRDISRGSSSSSSSTSSRNNSTRKRKGILSSCWSSLCFSNNSISAGS